MLGLGNSLISTDNTRFFTNKYSIAFDGTGDYLDTGSPFQAVFRDSFTISCWVKIADGRMGGIFQSFVAAVDDPTTNGINFYTYSDGKLTMYMVAGSDMMSVITDAAVFDNGANDWKHIAVTMTRSGSGNVTAALYVNGSAVGATTTHTLTEANQANFTSSLNIYIGGRNDNGSSFDMAFTGSMDEVAIWSAALDADAITAIYNSGSPTDLTTNNGNYDNSGDLEAYYRMEEGSGTTVVDSSTNSNNASFGGDPQWDSSIP